MKLLVLGLGNPDKDYIGTRHNLGSDIVFELGRFYNLKFRKVVGGFLGGQINNRKSKVFLILPQVYMNLTGSVVLKLLKTFKTRIGQLIIVQDDLDLALGKIKITCKGGSGGHRGINSVIRCLGSDRFIRLKVGIGRPSFDESVSEYVLNGWYADQFDVISKVVFMAVNCLRVIFIRGVADAMQRFHSASLRGGER